MPAFAFAYTYFGDSVVSTVMLVAKIILTLRHSGRALRGWIETENELKGLVSDLIHLTALHWQAEALLAPFVAARIYHEVARCHLVMTRFLAKISDSQGTVQRLLWAVSEEREFAAFKMQIIERRTVLGVILGLINSCVPCIIWSAGY
jgi:hypothetical protein